MTERIFVDISENAVRFCMSDQVRVERRGKSSPGVRKRNAAVNSIRSNTAGELRFIARPARPLSGGGLSPLATVGLDRWLSTTESGLLLAHKKSAHCADFLFDIIPTSQNVSCQRSGIIDSATDAQNDEGRGFLLKIIEQTLAYQSADRQGAG